MVTTATIMYFLNDLGWTNEWMKEGRNEPVYWEWPGLKNMETEEIAECT